MAWNELMIFFQSDVSLEGYQKHKVSKSADAPLTMAEVELKEVKQVCTIFR